MNSQNQLIKTLTWQLEAEGKPVTLRETHISWVLLAGDQALKIKKSVNFGFLDFSTLALRKHACEEELRLNRRFAPQLYLELVTIRGKQDHPELAGSGTPIEYAVRMRRFDESGLLSGLAEHGELEKRHIVRAAHYVADFHLQAAVSKADEHWGKPTGVHHWLNESLVQIKRLLEKGTTSQQIERIETLCTRLYTQREEELVQRKRDGYIRECHGDLHLGNMVWINQDLVAFDCLEFNPELRWIDVISEAAFIMMDLEERGYVALAWTFINTYLSQSGDYAGVHVLRYYLVYRALVRAKVSLLQKFDPDTEPLQGEELFKCYLAYASFAERCLRENRAVLLLMHGLSASGKSTVAGQLAEQYGCFHLRSDVERKRLHGLAALAQSNASIDTGIYSREASELTYQRLHELAESILGEGYPVIIDAAFLEFARRETFRKLAKTMSCPCLIIHCEADLPSLEARLKARARQGQDPSEATTSVLSRQISRQDELSASEQWTTVNSTQAVQLPASITKITGVGA